MGIKRWNVTATKRVISQLAHVTDRRSREALKIRLRRLDIEPEKQGKPLSDKLSGYYSVRAIGQRTA